MLAYDWFKIVIIIAAIAVAWSLAYSVGAPRASVGQTFGLFVYEDFYAADSVALLNEMQKSGALSYDVLDLGTRSLTEQYYATIMSAVTSVNEGDIMLISDFAEDAKNNKSHYRSFVDVYGEIVYDYDSLVSDAKIYCLSNGLVVEKNGAYSLDNEAISAYFYKRMEKDPRFRNDEKRAAGVIKETARIKSVWNNAVSLEKCLSEHPELKRTYTRFAQSYAATPEDYEEYFKKQTEKNYGLNLGALTGGKKQIMDLYKKTTYGENNEILGETANEIILCVFNYKVKQPDLQYETLGFVNYIIDNYSDFNSVRPSSFIV